MATESSSQQSGQHKGQLKAFVQTAPQAGRYVWVISLVDFGGQQIRRTIVSDDTFTTADAARVAGDAELKAMASDH